MRCLYQRWIYVGSNGYPACQLLANYVCNADDLSYHHQPGNAPGFANDFLELCQGWAFSALQNLRASLVSHYYLKNRIKLLTHSFCRLRQELLWISYQGWLRSACHFP